jgi:hypothetical protein
VELIRLFDSNQDNNVATTLNHLMDQNFAEEKRTCIHDSSISIIIHVSWIGPDAAGTFGMRSND